MIVTVALHWWYVPVGVPMALFGGWESGGWVGDAPKLVTFLGMILTVCAILFLIFGAIARALP